MTSIEALSNIYKECNSDKLKIEFETLKRDIEALNVYKEMFTPDIVTFADCVSFKFFGTGFTDVYETSTDKGKKLLKLYKYTKRGKRR